MNILFLSHYFPPEVNAPASRTFEHCREWVRAGHKVTVITGAPNHPRGEVYEGYRNRWRRWESVDGIDVLRVWTFIAANQGFGKRTLNYLSFMLSAILAGLFVCRHDVVISTSPQFFNGLAGFVVARMRRTAWLLEIRDLWPDSILAVGAISNRWVIRALKWFETFAYRKCDRLVVVTDAFARHISALDISREKIAVIKNGVRLDLFDKDCDASVLRRDLQLNDKIIAAYFGTHGMAHHLETILEAAELTAANQDVVYLLVGDGARRDYLVAECGRRSLNNVMMLPQQPKDLMPQFWAMADISLVLLRKSELFKTVIPSKIFEAMAMATPIVLGVEGEASDIVQRSGGGICIGPEDSSELANAVCRLAADPSRREQLGKRAYRHVEQQFSRPALAQRYLQELENAIANRSRSK